MTNAEALKAAGMDIDALPVEQKDALNDLDQSEVDALVAIREKLNAGAEVTGHAMNFHLPTDAGQASPVRPELADGILVW